MSDVLHRARFRMDHSWAPRRMSDYLDSELSPGRRARMERHVGECEECRRLLAGLRAMLDALHGLRAPGEAADGTRIATSVRVRLGEPPAPS
jgi:anti-sigma factor RsiW